MKPIIYATHPVAAEIKAAILAEGGKIIDAAFAPEGERIIDGLTGEDIATTPTEPPKPAPRGKAKA